MVKEITPPNTPKLFEFDGALYFNANDEAGPHGYELWRSDGTQEGTQLVKDINPGSSHSYPDYLTVFDGALYFSATNGTHGKELWRSDGTAAGTRLVKDIWEGGNGNPSGYFVIQ